MGLLAVLNEVRLLAKAMGYGDKIVADLKEQQVRDTKLSPKLRNAMAMYDLMKTDSPEGVDEGFTSFTDSNWHFLDIRNEIETSPAPLPANLAGAFDSCKSAVKAAQESDEHGWDRECAKWEKKNGRKYEPRPRPSLIGEPLE